MPPSKRDPEKNARTVRYLDRHDTDQFLTWKLSSLEKLDQEIGKWELEALVSSQESTAELVSEREVHETEIRSKCPMHPSALGEVLGHHKKITEYDELAFVQVMIQNLNGGINEAISSFTELQRKRNPNWQPDNDQVMQAYNKAIKNSLPGKEAVKAQFLLLKDYEITGSSKSAETKKA